MKLRSLLITLCFLASISIANGQMARLYTTESGLCSSHINNIHQDSKGFIWIATENGLTKFDGMTFINYRYERDKPASIASNLVVCMHEDSRGVHWVGTGAGLQIFDSEYNRFSKVELEDHELPDSDPYISSITEVPYHGRDFILATSSGHGVYVIDAETHTIDKENQINLNAELSSQFIKGMFLDSNGRLWFAYENGGISVIDRISGKRIDDIWTDDTRELKNTIVVNAFSEDSRKGDVLLGTNDDGIMIFDSKIGKIRRSYDKSARNCRISSLMRNGLESFEGENTFIAGMENGGIHLYDRKTESLTIMDLDNVPYNTSKWKVHCLLEDNQDNIWVGAFQTGVMIIPESMYGFDYHNLYCVTSITENTINGDIWIGMDGDGVIRYNKQGRTQHFNSENSKLDNNSVMALAVDKTGRLWVATYLNGLFHYTDNQGFVKFKDSESIGTPRTTCLEYSKEDNTLYVGTYGNGLSVIDLNSGQVVKTFSEDDHKWISSLKLDDNGLLWVGTYNGPMCYDKRSNTLLHYNHNEVQATSTFAFCKDNKGIMWIGTGEGLVGFDISHKTTRHYTEADGLSSNVINGIQTDEDGTLWISTRNGLSRLNPERNEFKNYYHYDGLQGNEFVPRSSFKSEDGKIFFGGTNGLTSFYPHIVDHKNHSVPPVYFSDLKVMNQQANYDPSLGYDNVLDKHISEAENLVLPYNRKVFSIEFSVLEYTNPQKIVYAYRMEGFDATWHTTGPYSRTITYTNLSEGRYTMQVKAYFEDEPDLFSYKELSIRILPPLHRSFLAYTLYILMAGGLIYVFIRYRKRRKQEILAKQESEIKELKLRTFTNISHEIRTPLTLVMSPLKKMREAENEPKQKELYNLMYRNCLRILRLVNQLLDMRKIDNGQMKLHFLETDVVYFIKDIMQSFDNLAVSRKISCTIDPTDTAVNLWIDQGNFDKIIFNILSNAFKHTPDNGHIAIRISSPVDNDGCLGPDISRYIEITIENSGSSVEDKYLDKLFDRFFQADIRDANTGSGVGLNLAKMLAELHHGDIRAYNTSDGVAFAVRIPVGKDHLTAEELTKPTNHKDLYTKNTSASEIEELSSEKEDVMYNPNDNETSSTSKVKKHIVLVDDDSEMRAYLKLELQSFYNVDICSNAKEAWAVISTTVPDAVITDLMMEGMDGAELCGKIKKNPGTNHIPVIVLTSSGDEENLQRCIDNGADRFFTKPISLNILKSGIDKAISTRETIKNKYSGVADYSYKDMSMINTNDKLMSKVINVIKSNIENSDFGVEDLSREVGMSRVHLNRKLKEIMNVSPSNLIRSIRLKQAAYLLINNKVNISEVAYKVGFSTHSYFTNSFHEYFGMTPKEFVTKYTDCKDEELLKRIFE